MTRLDLSESHRLTTFDLHQRVKLELEKMKLENKEVQLEPQWDTSMAICQINGSGPWSGGWGTSGYLTVAVTLTIAVNSVRLVGQTESTDSKYDKDAEEEAIQRFSKLLKALVSSCCLT